MPRPRRFRRFTAAIPTLAWRMVLGEAPPTGETDLSQMGRAVVANVSLTGMFFITEATFTRKMPLWVRMQLNNRSVQMPVLVCRITMHQVGEREHYGYGVRFLRSPETANALPVLAEYMLDQTELDWEE